MSISPSAIEIMSRGTNFRKIRTKKHKQNPHCFWCGVETILCNVSGGAKADNAATIDHIRSRNMPGRNNGTGILVLACNRCNNLRAITEQQFLRLIDEEEFYNKGNSRPQSEQLNKLQGKIMSMLISFVRQNGQFLTTTGNPKHGNDLTKYINRFLKEKNV